MFAKVHEAADIATGCKSTKLLFLPRKRSEYDKKVNYIVVKQLQFSIKKIVIKNTKILRSETRICLFAIFYIVT